MLTENDLYDVNLWKVTPRTFKSKALTGVDCESLATVFTAETGLSSQPLSHPLQQQRTNPPLGGFFFYRAIGPS